MYTFEHEDVEFERQLLKPEVYELNVAHFEESPQLLRNAISAQMRSIRTNGDGACGVHAWSSFIHRWLACITSSAVQSVEEVP